MTALRNSTIAKVGSVKSELAVNVPSGAEMFIRAFAFRLSRPVSRRGDGKVLLES